jgi:hypothetical protein
MSRRRAERSVTVVALCLAAVVLALAGCTGRSSSPVKDFWAEAEGLAEAWHDDAYLIEVRGGGDFAADLEWRDARASINYRFVSPGAGYLVAWVGCDYDVLQGCQLDEAFGSHADLAGCEPIELDDIVSDAQQVLDAALQHGEQYRDLESTRQVEFDIARSDAEQFWLHPGDPDCSGSVYWGVTVREYSADIYLSALVDAATGEVVRATE